MLGLQADYSRFISIFSVHLCGSHTRTRPLSKKDKIAVAEPPATETGTSVLPRRSEKKRRKRQPRYHVVLWDDDDHTYEYVTLMMRKLFGHTIEQGIEIAQEVDNSGRALCLTTTLEHAELKRDQIHAFGADPLIPRCKGSMWATIEAER